MKQTGLTPLLCALGFWKKEKPGGVISVRSAEGSLVVSQVSVMPRRSILLLAMRSDRAGALSRMERALTVPRRRLHTPGPGFRLTSPSSNRSRDMSKFSWIQGRWPHLPISAQRKSEGTNSKEGERVRWDNKRVWFYSYCSHTCVDPSKTVNAKTRILACQWQQQKEKSSQQ